MTEKPYVFANTQEEQEWQRLTAIEQEFDPGTRRILEVLGMSDGWSCLEVGPGAGSIVRYMCDRVGVQGHVVAVDINPRFVENIKASNLEVRRADITATALPAESFDLIHARYVVIHIKEYEKALANMIRALKPGGWLFLEEPDFTLSTPANYDRPLEQAVAQVFKSVVFLYSSMGIEPAIGRKLPPLLQQMNLEQIVVEASIHLSAGGSNMAKMMQMSISHLRQPLVETGIVSDEDINQFLCSTNNPTFWTVYYATVSTYGRKIT